MQSLVSWGGRARSCGLAGIGEVPWGTHICQFYRTADDLVEVLVPYFKAGLEANEQCVWVASEPLRAPAARSALREAVPDLDIYESRGQIAIVDYEAMYARATLDDVLHEWLAREESALRVGYDGLRVTGNTYSVERPDWDRFTDYEAHAEALLQGRRILAICSYCLDRCVASDLLDVLRNHGCTLVRDERRWRFIRRALRVPEAGRGPSACSGPQSVRAGHDVVFYDEGDFPAAQVAAFLAETIRVEGGGIAVATGPHLSAIRGALAALGLDVDSASRAGRLLFLDADKVLGWLHVGGELDEDQFNGVIGARVRDAAARFPRVRVFGEIVDLLARSGREPQAVRLEGWWNALRDEASFDILCAYSYADFAKAHSVARFEDVCAAHHHVGGAEALERLSPRRSS